MGIQAEMKSKYMRPEIGEWSLQIYGEIMVVQGSGEQGATGNNPSEGGDGIYSKEFEFDDSEEKSSSNSNRSHWD